MYCSYKVKKPWNLSIWLLMTYDKILETFRYYFQWLMTISLNLSMWPLMTYDKNSHQGALNTYWNPMWASVLSFCYDWWLGLNIDSNEDDVSIYLVFFKGTITGDFLIKKFFWKIISFRYTGESTQNLNNSMNKQKQSKWPLPIPLLGPEGTVWWKHGNEISHETVPLKLRILWCSPT